MRRIVTMVSVLALSLGSALGAQTPAVQESARQIPVAYQVDVVVVGGSTGAVAAAAAAARQGAKVFLAAPHPYLGDDMTATLRLWLEPGEVPTAPLAKQVFTDKGAPPPPPLGVNCFKYRYETDQPSASPHKDTRTPSMLADGAWGDAVKESVQYNTDVRITADLGHAQKIGSVRIMAHHRDGQKGFDVESATVELSDDKQTWKPIATLRGPRNSEDYIVLSAPVDQKARYVRVFVKKPADASRILLGEIEIAGPQPQQPKSSQPARSPSPRPMHVKKVLDATLLEAGVSFLYDCYATDVLRDGAGNPCGIVMANRAGRQAVVAKVIIDATPRACVARMAGGKFRPYPAGEHVFRHVVIGGEVQTGAGLTARRIEPPFFGPYPNRAKTSSGTFQIIEYTVRTAMKDDSYGSWAAAERRARDLTYHAQQQFTSDVLFEVPPDAMHAAVPADGPSQGVQQIPLTAFQPAGVARVYVLGGCADVARAAAEQLLRPLALMDLGVRIGQAAAAEAKSLPAPAGVKVPGAAASATTVPGEVHETLIGVRPTQKLPTIAQEPRPLAVLAQVDVVVIGGGTAGAPAGIAAARQGAKTLVIESLHGLGGVGTLGAISNYCFGNRVGFSATVGGGTAWIIEQKMDWWRKALGQAGADVWFGAIGCGTVVKDQQVIGVVVATPQGRGIVLAKVVVDATGNADLAAAAGVPCKYTDASELAMQGTGLPSRQLGATYTNTDFTITDDTDMVDVWQMLIHAKHKYPEAFDQGQLIDTRERRCVVGDFTMTILDQINRRTYPDTVCQALGGSYDTHGYTVDPYLIVVHPETTKLIVDVPYRCLLPKGLEGLLVTGLGLSAHRDALPLVRMQPDMQNLGYATGVAAAMAAKAGTLVRHIDIRALQKHLIEIGNLKPGVLDQQDSYPALAEQIAAVAKNLPKKREAAAVLFAQPEQAVPQLQKAYSKAAEKDRLDYALVLGVLGDATGLEPLMAEVRRAAQWDAGWNYKGMGQFGNALSPLDACIVALGRTGDRRAVPVVLEKLRTLTAADAFSHHRAVGLALEMLGDPAAARPLADLLAKPGISGYVHATVDVAIEREAPGGTNAEETRRNSIRELLLARALFRCGDYHGQGRKILEAYTHDLRGHLARHAQAVLETGK